MAESFQFPSRGELGHYLPSAIIHAQLLHLCAVLPPLFLSWLDGSGVGCWHTQGDAFSDHFFIASLQISIFQAYNYHWRQSVLLLPAYSVSCGCDVPLWVLTSCLNFPCWFGKLFRGAILSHVLGTWPAGTVLMMCVSLSGKMPRYSWLLLFLNIERGWSGLSLVCMAQSSQALAFPLVFWLHLHYGFGELHLMLQRDEYLLNGGSTLQYLDG